MNNNTIFINKETKEEYIATSTKDGKIKLYSIKDDSGNSDLTIAKNDFNNNYSKE